MSKDGKKKNKKKREKKLAKTSLGKKGAKRKDKKGKPSKSEKKALKGASRSEIIALGFCPCCKKHCQLSKPKCKKGKKLAEKLGVQTSKS